MSALQQNMCNLKAGFSSVSGGWAKYKEKVPKVSYSNQNVEATYNLQVQVCRT